MSKEKYEKNWKTRITILFVCHITTRKKVSIERCDLNLRRFWKGSDFFLVPPNSPRKSLQHREQIKHEDRIVRE